MGRASVLQGMEQEGGHHFHEVAPPSTLPGIWKEWKQLGLGGGVADLLGKQNPLCRNRQTYTCLVEVDHDIVSAH